MENVIKSVLLLSTFLKNQEVMFVKICVVTLYIETHN